MNTRNDGLFSEQPELQQQIYQNIHRPNQYVFKKLRTHFKEQEETVPTLENFPYHVITRLKKVRKESSWIQIKNGLVNTDKKAAHLSLAVTAGEIYRFEIGPTQPKYRIVDKGEEQNIVSKEIASAREFFHYYEKNILEYVNDAQSSSSSSVPYSQEQFFEGMGRVTIAKLIYDEDDLHFGNAFLDKDDYFVGIDQDRTFWPIACKNFALDQTKRYIAYEPRDKNIQFTVEEMHGHPWYLLKDKQLDFIGEMSAEDYDNLPIIQHYVPSHWDFIKNFVEPYSQKLAKHEQFLNEKHFQTIKSLTTSFMKDLIVAIHIDGANAKAELTELIHARLKRLEDICAESKTFIAYLTENRLSACRAILYECQEFLKTNKHYFPGNQNNRQDIWEAISNEILTNYNSLLQRCNVMLFTAEEKKELNKFVNKVLKHEIAAINMVTQFYLKQKMLVRAKKTLFLGTIITTSVSSSALRSPAAMFYTPRPAAAQSADPARALARRSPPTRSIG